MEYYLYSRQKKRHHNKTYTGILLQGYYEMEIGLKKSLFNNTSSWLILGRFNVCFLLIINWIVKKEENGSLPLGVRQKSSLGGVEALINKC